MKIKRFEDLEVWQASRELAREVYVLNEDSRLGKDRSLSDQIRRAAISVMANIAEGFERESSKEFMQFLNYSLASAAELKSHLYLSLDIHYITDREFQQIVDRLDSVARQIKGLRKYLKTYKKTT